MRSPKRGCLRQRAECTHAMPALQVVHQPVHTANGCQRALALWPRLRSNGCAQLDLLRLRVFSRSQKIPGAKYHGALGELYATVAVQGLQPSGPSGGLFSSELFQYERGEATVFVPVSCDIQTVGRVSPLVVPAAELAVTVHCGPHTNINATYGALGAYVAKHALAVAGPVREYYLVDARNTNDATQWRTEIGWPIFQTSK